VKNLIKKRNLIEPFIAGDVKIAIDETIHGKIGWTAAMPKGELAKLKKVCKPVAVRDDLTVWVLDKKKAHFFQNNT